jgi:hypothetical protein
MVPPSHHSSTVLPGAPIVLLEGEAEEGPLVVAGSRAAGCGRGWSLG